MLDHLSDGRFEFGTGRGAGSHEILGFLPGMEDLSPAHARDLGGRHRRVRQDVAARGVRGLRGQVLVAAAAQDPAQAVRQGPHPAMWYAAGNTSSYEMAARKGLGVLGFSVGDLASLEPVIDGVQGGDRQTPSRSARSSTTTSW